MSVTKLKRQVKRKLTVATSGGNQILVKDSPEVIYFTGTMTHTLTLADATTFPNFSLQSAQVTIFNNSTGAITVNYDDNTNLTSVGAGESLVLTLLDNSTSNGVWMQQTGSGGGGGGFTVVEVNSNIGLLADNSYHVDTTAARSLSMPVGPSSGDQLRIVDKSGQAGTNAITLTSSDNIQGGAAPYLLESDFGSWTFEYGASGWRIVA